MEEEIKKEPIKINGRIQGLHHLIVGLFLFVGVSIILNLASIYLATWFVGEDFSKIQDSSYISSLMENPTSLRIILVFGSSLSFIVATWLTLLFVKANPFVYTSLSEKSDTQYFLGAILLLLVCLPIISSFLEINEWIGNHIFSGEIKNWFLSKEAENERLFGVMLETKGGMNLMINLFVMALLPALSEEIFFRGFLLKVFYGLTKNIHVGILITSLIFAAIHLQFFKFMPMVLISIILGYLVYWSRSLWPAILLHGINNSLVVLAYYYSENSTLEILDDSYRFPIWIVAIGAVGFIVIFRYFHLRKNQKLNNFYE
jgi:membrane protease YdiL (CAAX protease family)